MMMMMMMMMMMIIGFVVVMAASADALCTRLTVPCPQTRPVVHFRELEISRESVKLISKLGDGRFGDVWKGKLWDTVDVAVKILKPDTKSQAAFLEEGKVLCRLRHVRILQVLAVCTADTPAYIVTELMAGGTLLLYLRRDDGQLVTFPAVVRMAGQLADGLAYLERQKILHLDLRAANILVGDHQEVKVADFSDFVVLQKQDWYDISKDLGTEEPVYSDIQDDNIGMDKEKGICLIINNRDFFKDLRRSEAVLLTTRLGTDADRDNLKTTFRNLKFIVEVHENQTDTQMLQVVNDAARKDHRAYDCFVCCVLSHGSLGVVYGANGVSVAIRDLTSQFRAQLCPSLRDKPKLFFLQACQGSEEQTGFNVQSDADGEEEVQKIPDEADFLLGYSTVPGFRSYRETRTGSWYIRNLTETLNKCAEEPH
nr:hypothetical protein BaRGS_010734 [Batillaria attramentaria]